MDKKVSDLTEVINLVDDALFYVVDTADLSEDVAGTSKKIKKSSLIKKASILHSGTVKTDITEADPVVYTKTTMDSLLGAKADLVGGKVPASQLPSYLDDVVEVADFASLPVTGERGIIYITIDNNKQYRWTGTVYVEFSAGVSDHNLLSNIGTNTHSQIDAHISNISNPHATTLQQVLNAGNVSNNTSINIINNTNATGGFYIINTNSSGKNFVAESQGTSGGKHFIGKNGSSETFYVQPNGQLRSRSVLIGGVIGDVNTITDNGIDALQVNGSTLSTAFKKTGDTNANILLAGGGVTALSGLATTTNLATKENTITAGTTSQYWRGDKTFQNLDKTAVGLSNVDNTTDLLKPISTATQTALDLKQGTLISGTNIKTINGTTILGSGDIVTFSGSIVPLNEGNGIGYVIEGRNPANYGNIGLGAVDLSTSDSASSTRGATGLGSFATGLNNIAGGQYSSAFGNGNNVTNNFSVCFGDRNLISSIGSFGCGIFNQITTNSDYSAVFGNGNIIGNDYCAAFGSGNTVSNHNGAAFGSRNFARAGGEFVIGLWSTDYTPDGINDRLFNVGRGFSEATRNDVYTLFKNGAVRFFRETLANIGNPLSGMLIFDSGNTNRPTIHDGTAWRPLAYNDQFIDKEIPSGLINGSNVTFTLVNTPVVGSEHVYRNGILQESGAGNDYTISGPTITYLTAPLTGDKLRVTYRR